MYTKHGEHVHGNGLEEVNLPQCTTTVIGYVWDQLLEDVEARNDVTKQNMWNRMDFFRQRGGRGKSTRSHHFRKCLRALQVVASGRLE